MVFVCHFNIPNHNGLEIERISHLAFKEAEKRRNQLTLVDKANVLETSRLWRDIVQKISKEYKLADAKQAHEDLESRKLTGPAILLP